MCVRMCVCQHVCASFCVCLCVHISVMQTSWSLHYSTSHTLPASWTRTTPFMQGYFRGFDYNSSRPSFTGVVPATSTKLTWDFKAASTDTDRSSLRVSNKLSCVWLLLHFWHMWLVWHHKAYSRVNEVNPTEHTGWKAEVLTLGSHHCIIYRVLWSRYDHHGTMVWYNHWPTIYYSKALS